MNIDNKLEKLKKISRVDVPPFLFTRIKQRIDSINDVPISLKWKLARTPITPLDSLMLFGLRKVQTSQFVLLRLKKALPYIQEY